MSDRKLLKNIERVLSNHNQASFQPTNEQKRLKAQFWTVAGTNLPPAPDRALAAQYVDVGVHWDTPGFPAWLWNAAAFDAQVDYLAQVSVEELEKLLLSTRAGDAVKLGAIKLSLELAKKIGKPADSEGMLDDKIAQMSKAQLEDYIQKSLKLVTKPE